MDVDRCSLGYVASIPFSIRSYAKVKRRRATDVHPVAP